MRFYSKDLHKAGKDCSGLGLLERGAYDALFDAYYATEAPLPHDRAELYRLLGLTSAVERRTVDLLLPRFFVSTLTGWRNKEADEWIAHYRDKCRKRAAAARSKWTRPSSKTTPRSDANAHAIAYANAYANAHAIADREAQLSTAIAETNKAVNYINQGVNVTPLCASAREGETENRSIENKDLAPKTEAPSAPSAWYKTEAGLVERGRELGIPLDPGEDWAHYRGRIFAALDDRRRRGAA